MNIKQRFARILTSVSELANTVGNAVVDPALASSVYEFYEVALPVVGDERLKPLLNSLTCKGERKVEDTAAITGYIASLKAQVLMVAASKVVSTAHKALVDGDPSELAQVVNNLTRASSMLDVKKAAATVERVSLSKDTIASLPPNKYDYTYRTGTVFDSWATVGSGELGVILAPPSVGKTTALVQIGRALAQKPALGVVYHFTLEMSVRSIIAKYLAGWDYNNEKVNIIHASAGSIGVDFIDSVIETDLLNSKAKAACIIVDHLIHLATPNTNRSGSKYDAISENVLKIRALGNKYRCPVWTATQPQRAPVREMRSVPAAGSGGYVLGMQDVAECWAIPQVADLLTSINQTEQERENFPPIARVHAAKIRNPSPIRPHALTVETTVDYENCVFTPESQVTLV
jgi:hypothetical protein